MSSFTLWHRCNLFLFAKFMYLSSALSPLCPRFVAFPPRDGFPPGLRGSRLGRPKCLGVFSHPFHVPIILLFLGSPHIGAASNPWPPSGLLFSCLVSYKRPHILFLVPPLLGDRLSILDSRHLPSFSGRITSSFLSNQEVFPLRFLAIRFCSLNDAPVA